jgi:hypothetical protein
MHKIYCEARKHALKRVERKAGGLLVIRLSFVHVPYVKDSK